ncbi:MAG TPA: SpvB/TcaC N-terminal domain-containing protein [Puia sp.]|jgi:RHS repeat-associated protein|nr:SpvB/TcaC N-terminal domain-containing protein [Puia sp.]
MQPDKTGSPGKRKDHSPSQIPYALNEGRGDDYAKTNLLQIPSINIPKGGGALKSIDEKFQVNAANGTSSLHIAIPLSKSRSDFAPSLSLNYSSGSGNSPFGLGWNISLPTIRRRTDKKLPLYRDACNSDIFQLSGVEDMVAKLVKDAGGDWQPDIVVTGSYHVKRYVPRIEGAFTLIEQVQAVSGVYWKTTSKDNVVMYYGISEAGRVADPDDPSRIYEWLPEICYDDKGNCYQYYYVPEDLANVPALLHEGNRLNGNQRIANTYLKRIVYGNTQPYSPTPSGATPDPYNPFIPDGTGYLFNLVLDYGDHDPNTPTPSPSTTWGCRLDPFSNGKAGFDWRTYRLCRRFLLFHLFPELDPDPVMVRSVDIGYRYYDFQPVADPYALVLAEADFITSITETGWTGTEGGGYQQYSYPSLGITYQMPVWNSTVETIPAENRMNIPEGLSAAYQFTDLYNEGIAGILSEHSEGWYYNSNLGGGVFTPASLIAPKPSFTGLDGGGLQLQSLTGDGRKFIVSTERPNTGYFELTDDHQRWLPYIAFDRYPAVDLKDPNIKLIDLNGDGMPDIVLSEEEVFTWYPAAGTMGYDSPELAPKSFDEEKGPAIVFADPVQSIFLADMTGDGLTDIVRIRNGEISYWPNLGYGIFGAKVNMTNAPEFDTIDAFNPAYLHLADINGTGATDVLYLGQDKLRAWLNLSGNAWGNPFEAPAFPHTASPNQLSIADFLGNGTACIVWSSPLAANADEPLQYIDLMGGIKPYLMSGYSNGMGKTATFGYKSSTYYYLQDKLAGTPWITKLCFPVQCVASVRVQDVVSGTQYSNSYTYHHGYYAHAEKEYRGFARVDQTDVDIFDTNALADQVPMFTKTWFHTGAYFGIDNILHQLAQEYFQNPAFSEYDLPEPTVPGNMTAGEAREAARACKGMTLRQEVYALDSGSNPTLAPYPYSVAEHNNNIILLQPQGPNLYAVFLSTESEIISYQYERNPADPRISHTLNTAFDAYGNIVDSYTVVYARQTVNPADPGGISLPGNQPLPAAVLSVQQQTSIIYTHHAYTGQLITSSTYRLPLVCESITWQWAGPSPANTYYSINDFTHPSAPPVLTKLKHQRSLFLQDDLATPLPLYSMDSLGLLYQQYHLAIDATVTALNGKTTTVMLQQAQYIRSDDYTSARLFPPTDATGEWWVPSGKIVYLDAGSALPYLLPHQFLDAYGYATTLLYDGHWLLPVSITDPVNNTITAAPVNYRVLWPQTVTDANGNAMDYRYDSLGLLVAVAQRGKGEGDVFDPGFTADLTAAQVAGFFSDPYTNGPALLQGATTRYIYDFVSGGPFSSGSVSRQIHANQVADPRADTSSVPYIFSFEYSDGLGRTAMKKVMADPDTGAFSANSCMGPNPPTPRWIGSGKTVYNNKGNPVMRYEPYFSPTPAYEEAPANGVSAVLYYDPANRLIRTKFPDGSFSTTTFNAWVEIFYDQNDTVLDSDWYQQFVHSADLKDVDAANKAAAHYNTPTVAHLDPLGRNFYTVAFNMTGGIAAFYATQILLDLSNNPLSIVDAMGNTTTQWEYDLLNRPLHQQAMDGGERWMLCDVMGKLLTQWDQNDSNSFVYVNTYDNLHRPLQATVGINGTSYLASYNVYGENISINGASDTSNNLRGKLYRQYDDSGLVTHYLYDFKGNLIQSSRIFTNAAGAANALLPVIAWSGDASDLLLLSGEEYVSLSAYDALNRLMLQVRPFIPVTPKTIIPPPYTASAVNHSDVIVPGYGTSGTLNTMNVYAGGGAVSTPFVTRICHNEKGQRLCIQYGNNTVTRYSYDPDTFRLVRQLTTVNKGAVILQDLRYYYDPVGNITYILDNAQPPVFYNNQQVLSDCNYTYDAVYRLISATGREQIAQNIVDESSANTNYADYPFDAAPMPAPTDPLAMRSYTQNFTYDAAGNMKQLQHVAGTGSYTRTFYYNNNAADRAVMGVPASAILNNQLLATTIGSNPPEKYAYDGHGNMLNLPQLPGMGWNYKDQLARVTQQSVSVGTGQTTYYTYDASGMRTRKATLAANSSTGKPVTERLYIGNLEIYRSYDGSGNITLQRETLHVKDDKNRIALVDNKTIDTTGSDSTNLNTWYPRYQYNSDINSAAYELDGSGNIISYEEYHPFGTSSYEAADAALDVPAKRYRFTGKERDEESGLYYHGARYYAPWLCRWTSADPAGSRSSLNAYDYCHANPVVLVDDNGKYPSWAPTWTDVKDAGKTLKGYGEGLGDAVVDTAKGLGQVVAHPVDTVQHVSDAVTHPSETYHAIANAVDKGTQEWVAAIDRGDTETAGRMVGHIIGNLALAAAPGAEGGALGGLLPEAVSVPSGLRFAPALSEATTLVPEVVTTVVKVAPVVKTATVVGTIGHVSMMAGPGSGNSGGNGSGSGGSGSGSSGNGSGSGSGSGKGSGAPKKGSGSPKGGGGGSAVKKALGPAYKTFEEAAEAAAKSPATRSGNPPHVLGVIVRDASGAKIGEWFEVSEGGSGMLGHTEQKALARMNLKGGETVEFVGHYSPCNLEAGCSSVMSDAAKKLNVDIRYRYVRDNGTTVYDFKAGEGQQKLGDVPRRSDKTPIH